MRRRLHRAIETGASAKEPLCPRKTRTTSDALNSLLFDAANKTDDFTRHKVAIIEAGNALQDSYLAALQQCCRKHDEVLKLEEYVLTRFQRALPVGHVRDEPSKISPAQNSFDQVADQFVDPSFPFLRRIA